MKADWTDGSPAIEEWLTAFDSVSIPLAIIFPGDDPLHPIVLRDIVVKNELLRKLDEAVKIKSDVAKLTQALTSANDFKLSTTRQRVVCLLKSFATRLRVVLFFDRSTNQGTDAPVRLSLVLIET